MFRSIIESSPFGVWIIDENGSVVFRNKSAAAMAPPEVQEDAAHIPMLPPGISIENGKLSLSALGDGVLKKIISFPNGKGDLRYCEVSLNQFTEAGGQLFYIVSLHEVTSRFRAWQALTDQEERWNLALEGSQIGVFESDLRSGKGAASDTWFKLLGICDAQGRDSDQEWRARIHPEDRKSVEALDNECIAGRVERSEAKFRMRDSSGAWRWMQSILRVTERDTNGKAVRLLGTMMDITALESALELAEARKNGLEMLMAHAPVAMAVLDLDGTFLLMNDSCYALFGLQAGQLEEKSFWKLSKVATFDRVRNEVERLLLGDVNASRIEEEYVRPDGDVIDIVVRLSIVRRAEPTDSRLIVQMADVTEQKRLDALKDDFVATVSHELRTPLASIHGALRLLDKEVGDQASAQSRKLLALAGRNSNRLTAVVNDLLDFQKLASERFPVEMKQINAVDLVRQAILDNEPYAQKFAVATKLETAQDSVNINADPQRFAQVLANLLSNACKFCVDGGTVWVRVETDLQNCKISVTNKGIGISSEFKTRIFQPFSQQADTLTRNREGTGLGLAISKEMVEKMAGEIGYASKPNDETTFWVRFPIYSSGEAMLEESVSHPLISGTMASAQFISSNFSLNSANLKLRKN